MPQPNSEQRHRESETALNGQQMSALQKQMHEKLLNIAKDVDLRKWSVDQACSLAGVSIEHDATTVIDAVKMAREIHRFLTEGTNIG